MTAAMQLDSVRTKVATESIFDGRAPVVLSLGSVASRALAIRERPGVGAGDGTLIGPRLGFV